MTTLFATELSLFDGRTLEGWQGNSEVWRVEDGAIVGGSFDGNPRNEFLTTKRRFKNFHLSLQYRLIGEEGFVNGGVQFRSERCTDPDHEMIGYQADIGHGYSGCLYDESRRKKVLGQADVQQIQRLERIGEWNHYEILAENERVRLRLNGETVLDYAEKDLSLSQEGLIGLQIHGNCKAQIAFKDIRIVELSDEQIPTARMILERFGDAQAEIQTWPPFEQGQFSPLPKTRMVLLGQENLVRLQKKGLFEALMLRGFSQSELSLRSMAWEGDTVFEQWRDLNFGDWLQQLRAVQANTLLLQFGQIEALQGVEKLAEFTSAYHRLLDELIQHTPRIVLVSPIAYEVSLHHSGVDLRSRQQDLETYVNAIQAIAQQRGLVFLNLYESSLEDEVKPWTDNGLHLNDLGVDRVSHYLAQALGAAGVDKAVDAKVLARVQEKNRLWNDCWRPANWNFVYGDRMVQAFARGEGDSANLAQVFEQHKSIIESMELEIQQALLKADLSQMDWTEPKAVARSTEANVPNPEQILASFELAEGFQAQLFASEALGVVKPTHMTFDERGRLWVACSPTYPHALIGHRPNDYILILEDRDGDGTADHSTRFAEGLTMVQGLELGDGGVYVCDFDRIVHLRDTDGDDRSDIARVVYSGFGIGDTHQLINSIRYGPDGALWFSQGLHAFSRVETPFGLASLHKAGIWRMAPRTKQLQAFFNGAKAGHNCWGVAFDAFGQVFHKSGDRPHGYYTVPGLGRYPQPQEFNGIGNLFDTSPKTTAIDILGSAALPKELQGAVVIGGYFGHLVELHRLTDHGAGFKSEAMPRLLTSNEESFRPVAVRQGPNGQIFIGDWANPEIGHYQTHYNAKQRDHRHGRIWVVKHESYAAKALPKFHELTLSQRFDLLENAELWTKQQAQRLLFNASSPEVLREIQQRSTGGLSAELLIAYAGLCQAHGAIPPELLKKMLEHKDARVRAYVPRLIMDGLFNESQALAILGQLVRDAESRVRLESVVACSYLDSIEAVAIALKVLRLPTDAWIDYALKETLSAAKQRGSLVTLSGQSATGLSRMEQTLLNEIVGEVEPAKSLGQEVYEAICLNCHQATGEGLKGVYPPLRANANLQGDVKDLVRIVTHGLTGVTHVKGEVYGQNVAMPAMGLTSEQTAAVLNYLRSEKFDNMSAEITTAEVEALRKLDQGRTQPWTLQELKR